MRAASEPAGRSLAVMQPAFHRWSADRRCRGPCPAAAAAAASWSCRSRTRATTPLHWLERGGRRAPDRRAERARRSGAIRPIAARPRVRAAASPGLGIAEPGDGDQGRSARRRIRSVVGYYSSRSDALVGRTAHSIRLDAGRLQPEVTERRPTLDDLFARLRAPRRRLGPGGAAPGRRPHPPLDAFENYIKGLMAESPASQATVPRDGAPGFAGLRPGAARAVGRSHGTGRSPRRARGGPRGAGRRRRRRSRARFFAGISLIELKRYDEALGVFKALAASRRPRSQSAAAAVLNNLGVLVIRRGATPRPASPAYYLTKATDADPDPDYMFNLGYAYASDRNYQGALYWLREALRRDPADVDAHYVLAVALNATGNTSERPRERDLARRLSSRYDELDRRAAENRTAVPPGLERMRLDPEGSWALARRPDDRQLGAARAARARRRSISSRAGGCSSASRIARRWPSCARPSTCRRTRRRRICSSAGFICAAGGRRTRWTRSRFRSGVRITPRRTSTSPRPI